VLVGVLWGSTGRTVAPPGAPGHAEDPGAFMTFRALTGPGDWSFPGDGLRRRGAEPTTGRRLVVAGGRYVMNPLRGPCCRGGRAAPVRHRAEPCTGGYLHMVLQVPYAKAALQKPTVRGRCT